MDFMNLKTLWNDRIKWLKAAVPYLGIFPLSIVVYAVMRGKQDTVIILLREILMIFGYVASVSDIRSKTVPNDLIKWMLYVWVLLVVPQLFLRTNLFVPFVVSGLLGFVLSGFLLLIVYLVSKKGLGGGDVKFMSVSGLYLGLYGVFPALLYGSILSAVSGCLLLVSRKIHKSDTIPLIPFLYVGILIAIFIQQEVFL